jgi:hypothetical protein
VSSVLCCTSGMLCVAEDAADAACRKLGKNIHFGMRYSAGGVLLGLLCHVLQAPPMPLLLLLLLLLLGSMFS